MDDALVDDRARATDGQLRRVRRIADPERREAVVCELLSLVRAEEQALCRLRDDGVRELRRLGWSYGRIAALTGLTRARVAQIAHHTPDDEPA